MKTKLSKLILNFVLALTTMLVFSSCNQFRNDNDWPMKKGSQPVHVPKEVSSHGN